MRTLTLGQIEYRLVASARAGHWVARAERLDNGDRFGIECAGAAEAEAVGRLTRWLTWQREHADALDAVQRAEHAYHRTVAGSAFASPLEGPTTIEMQRESLDALEAARVRLDEIRAQNPEA